MLLLLVQAVLAVHLLQEMVLTARIQQSLQLRHQVVEVVLEMNSMVVVVGRVVAVEEVVKILLVVQEHLAKDMQVVMEVLVAFRGQVAVEVAQVLLVNQEYHRLLVKVE
jgi:hypothetical protein